MHGHDPKNEHPIRRGIRIARTVAPAGTVLVAAAVALLVGYYHVPAVTRALDVIAEWKVRGGILFPVVSTAIFGGVIPIIVQQSMRATRTDAGWRKLPYLTLFWAVKGVEIDLLYRVQALVFGDDTALGTIVPKVLLDQFVYGPVWALPSTVLGYMLADHGYDPRRLFAALGGGWYRRLILPVLIANWFVWVPSVAVIYCLKLPLQLPIQNLVLCLWSVLLLVMVHKPVTRPAKLVEDDA